jgi:hypothetical protein
MIIVTHVNVHHNVHHDDHFVPIHTAHRCVAGLTRSAAICTPSSPGTKTWNLLAATT